MAPPTRFNSVRTGGSRPVARKPTFRDDSNLVGFRYDKAVAAEPPVHVTRSAATAAASTRPRPLQRSLSSSTTKTASSSYSYAPSISAVSLAGTAATSIHGVSAAGGGPVIVAPPRLSMPVVAPPTEQHPALRSPVPQQKLEDLWKRDSGHGSSSLMTKTIPEEEVRSSVNEPSQDDDCSVEKRPTSKRASWGGAASHIEHSPASVTASAISGTVRARGQSLNGVRPVTARAASVAASTAGPPSRYSARGTRAATKNSTVLAAAAGASRTVPSSPPVLPPLDLHISSFATSSSSSPSSYNHPPAAASAASASSPTPVSSPSLPSRASPLRWLPKRQSLRLSFWGGSRDDGAPAAHPQPQQHKSAPALAPTAPRRWQSVAHLRGGSTGAINTRPATAHIAGNQAPAVPIAGNTTIAGGLAPGTATPAPASSAKLQPHVSPAQSSSRSTLTMSSPSDPARDSAAKFSPLGIAIPTDRLLDEDFISSLNFSKRGSLMFDPNSVGAMDRVSLTDDDRSATPTQRSSNAAAPRPASSATSYVAGDDDIRVPTHGASPTPDGRVMAPDVEQESQKVRQLYASGELPTPLPDNVRHSYCDRLEPTPEVLTEDDESVAYEYSLAAPAAAAALSPVSDSTDSCFSSPQKWKYPRASFFRAKIQSVDPAGGFEDWDDLDSAMVDRYGFIGTPRTQSRVGTPTEMRSLHHSPRRRNVLSKRDPMGFTSNQNGMRLPSRKVSARSLNTQHSEVSIVSFRSSRSVIRQAGNLLPQNRNRRWMDEAGDMLTVSPNLQDSVEEARVEKISEALKRKEIDRSEKWRRMARVNRNGGQGQGMDFEFDTKNPKLIERTWKGIPDRWRAAAWWSFLATSAKEHPGSATEDDITAAFRRLQDCASADDIQIDLDVPRTISRHIMFRRRYRGGQRLLFRVLHALSLYFLETGYVQGMASLAATLLCYFDEEKCFVMLVRMWQLRGLERLYQPGFEGLMAALREFETTWLHKDVARRMTDLGIDSTAYGTRWYLTLFNLSIPFAAQLRVWDVFLLLGDPADGELPDDMKRKQSESPPMPSIKENPAALTTIPTKSTIKTKTPSSGLDVLHATSAALIQALREVLLDSDFENAMKALTAWIPIKDEDLLMKVTRAEWKTQLKKRS